MALPQRPPSLPPPPIRFLTPTLSDARQRTLTGRRVQPAAEGLRHGSAALACSSRSAEPSRSSVVRCGIIVGQRVTLCAVWHAAWYSGVCCAPCVITGVCCRCCRCVLTPVELIKCRLQAQLTLTPSSPGASECAQRPCGVYRYPTARFSAP